ncbi:hypothetical protein VNI00_014264 [Paramarasmius palmivorus]|uniref:SH3 domain-containing protein n=1 Tax=Paramarasmius palmivorus TaxID=297713 RepID=A0AAW0BW94_9AGAR
MRPPVPVAPSQSTVRRRVLDEVPLNLPAHASHPAPSQLEEPTNGGQRRAVLPTSVVTEDHVVDILSPTEQESLEEATPRNRPAFAPSTTGIIEVYSEPTDSEQESFYSSFSVAPSNINTSVSPYAMNQAMQSSGYESNVSDRWSALSIQPGSPQSPYQLDFSSSHPPDPATSLSPQDTLSFSSYSSREHSPAASQYSDVPVLEPSLPSSFKSLIVGGTTVRCTFIPTLDDELWIAVGEIIKVLREYDDGWALCENAGRQRGVVPVECLERGPVKVEHRMRNQT